MDEDLCKHQDVPTDRLSKREGGGGTFPGLAGLDIWWRPVRATKETLNIQTLILASQTTLSSSKEASIPGFLRSSNYGEMA